MLTSSQWSLRPFAATTTEPPATLRPSVTAPDRPRIGTKRLLLVLGGAMCVLCVVFGGTIVKQHRAFSEYRSATLETGPLPWDSADVAPDECVRFAVDWGMACPGLGTWCENESPRVVERCMQSRDRTQYCAALGDAPSRTDFGYDECARLREPLDGRHAQKAHKKFCAAAYRAVAQSCR
jgi:hypothetical protein